MIFHLYELSEDGIIILVTLENGGFMTKEEKSVQQVFDEKDVYISGEYRNQLEKSSGGFRNYFKKNFLLIMIALGVWVIAYYQITSHKMGWDYDGFFERKWSVNFKLVSE